MELLEKTVGWKFHRGILRGISERIPEEIFERRPNEFPEEILSENSKKILENILYSELFLITTHNDQVSVGRLQRHVLIPLGNLCHCHEYEPIHHLPEGQGRKE